MSPLVLSILFLSSLVFTLTGLPLTTPRSLRHKDSSKEPCGVAFLRAEIHSPSLPHQEDDGTIPLGTRQSKKHGHPPPYPLVILSATP